MTRNKKPMTAKLIIAGATLALIAVIGGATALTWPATPAEGEFAELPNGYNDAMTANEFGEQVTGAAWAVDISNAMQNDDREAFLAHSSGAAREKMAKWWDNTKAIGWDLGYAVHAPTDDGPSQLLLGVELAFSSHPVRGSGSPDAGLILTQNFPYTLTTDGEGDDLVITDWEPLLPMPWDDGDIYVAKRDHVVLYGLESEKALVDANIETAEEAAVLALDTLERIGGQAPIDGFVSAITDSDDNFDGWLGRDELDWTMDVAGFAASTQRPSFVIDNVVPPGVATGFESSGSLVVMGPLSADSRLGVFVHEFAHVMHESAVPYSMSAGVLSPAPVEGFARYFEVAAGVTDGYFNNPSVSQLISGEGESAMTEEALRNKDAHLAYDVAGSFYQYVEDSGGSAWQLALDRDNGLTMGQRAKEQNQEFSEAGWQAWAAAQ